jgi:hypothetical protein
VVPSVEGREHEEELAMGEGNRPRGAVPPHPAVTDRTAF